MKTERYPSEISTALSKRVLKTVRYAEDSEKQGSLRTGKNSCVRDYHSVRWDRQNLLKPILQSVLSVVILAYFFYRSALAVIPLSVIGVLMFRKKAAELAAGDRMELESQFGEAIRGVETALKAGYSVENAFLQSGRDMGRQFGERSFIYEEMEVIRKGIVMNITLEESLSDLGKRSGSEAIEDFARVFAIAKRCGGSMPEVISSSVSTITLQIETREEIAASLSGRRMEQNIMKIMPFGILAYVGMSSPGYFDPLYGNVTGIMIMTGLLLLYLAAFYLGDRILGKLEEGQ